MPQIILAVFAKAQLTQKNVLHMVNIARSGPARYTILRTHRQKTSTRAEWCWEESSSGRAVAR
jgi:hypothetical protein